MTDSTPISPPEAASNPLSPVTRSSSFPHKTSAATPPTHTHIDTSTPAINEFAVEIDGTAIEDEATLETGGTKGEKSGGLKQLGAGGPGQEKSAHGIGGLIAKGVEGVEGLVGGLLGNRKGDDTLEEQEDVDEEFLGSGERGAGKEVREVSPASISVLSLFC
jgi:hypothetical protein